MAQIAYILPPSELSRELLLDTLAVLADDGCLTRSQERSIAMLSAHRTPSRVGLAQRTPKGLTIATFNDDAFRVTRTGHIMACDWQGDCP